MLKIQWKILNWDTLKLEKLYSKKHLICFDRLELDLKKTVKVNKSVLQASEDFMNGAILIWSTSNINYQVLKISFRFSLSFYLIIQSLWHLYLLKTYHCAEEQRWETFGNPIAFNWMLHQQKGRLKKSFALKKFWKWRH